MQHYRRAIGIFIFMTLLMLQQTIQVDAQLKNNKLKSYNDQDDRVSRQDKIIIKGFVNDINGIPLDDVDIFVKNRHHKTLTDVKGNFVIVLPRLTDRKIHLVFDKIHYKTIEKIVDLKDENTTFLKIQLPLKQESIDNVNIKSVSPIQTVRESPFNVVVLDAKAAYNSTMQLSDLLNKASGVKVRQSGGLGSSTSISLNGFTGRSVKLFMDGVPMNGFGSAFQLNNIPVNMADRIEIYKGVVPIEFGTDAMGGVINIVTNQSANTFVDASYSYGSFNTHKLNLSFGHTTDNGFSFQANAFMNYSDNDYKMRLSQMTFFSDDGKTTTTETGNFVAKRFNDRYRNQTAQLKVGFVKKWWADRFFLGLTTAHEDAGVQNATVVDIVYGKRSTSSNSFLPSLEYDKGILF